MLRVVSCLLFFVFFVYLNVESCQAAGRKNIINPVRAWHLELLGVSLGDAKKLVDTAESSGFNTVVVQLRNWVRFDNAPWKAMKGAWTKNEFLTWVSYARKHGMTVVPEIKLLTHQEKFFQDNYPELMFNRVTYDPRKNDVYKMVFPFLEEVINELHPKAIHIGHDEVAGHSKKSRNKWLPKADRMLPANLFLQDILKLYKYLSAKNIETWIWGDMLVSRNEFPQMLYNHLHGDAKGYGKKLRDQLPRDIVICDWHYFDSQMDFPSLSVLGNEGFHVIGATWKKEKTIRNFSHYAARHGALGMMATIWFYAPRREWNTVNRILQVSGRIFSQDFPDAQ